MCFDEVYVACMWLLVMILHWWIMKKLLPVHAPHMQCEETSAEAVERHEHCGDNVRGNSQPSMREADGNSNPSAEANTVSC